MTPPPWCGVLDGAGGAHHAGRPLRALRFVFAPDVPSTSDPVMDFLAEDLPPESALPRRRKEG
jgi:hypothetical protein